MATMAWKSEAVYVNDCIVKVKVRKKVQIDPLCICIIEVKSVQLNCASSRAAVA